MSSPEYIQGRISYLRDELQSANPYTQTRDRQEWNLGWQHARLETESSRPQIVYPGVSHVECSGICITECSG